MSRESGVSASRCTPLREPVTRSPPTAAKLQENAYTTAHECASPNTKPPPLRQGASRMPKHRGVSRRDLLAQDCYTGSWTDPHKLRLPKGTVNPTQPTPRHRRPPLDFPASPRHLARMKTKRSTALSRCGLTWEQIGIVAEFFGKSPVTVWRYATSTHWRHAHNGILRTFLQWKWIPPGGTADVLAELAKRDRQMPPLARTQATD